jgi:hypothetical protein
MREKPTNATIIYSPPAVTAFASNPQLATSQQLQVHATHTKNC